MKVIETLNVITKWLVITPFLVWAVWELVLLGFRFHYGTSVRLVSQIAERLSYQGLGALAYFMTGLAVHFFVNWERPAWIEAYATHLGVLFWGVGVFYLVFDLVAPGAGQLPFWRYPSFIAGIAAILAFVCFPQAGILK